MLKLVQGTWFTLGTFSTMKLHVSALYSVGSMSMIHKITFASRLVHNFISAHRTINTLLNIDTGAPDTSLIYGIGQLNQYF